MFNLLLVTLCTVLLRQEEEEEEEVGRFAVEKRRAGGELCAGWEGCRVEEGQKTSRRGRCCEGGRWGVCGERKGVGWVQGLSRRGGCWRVGER